MVTYLILWPWVSASAYLGEGNYLRKYGIPKPEWILVLAALLSVFLTISFQVTVILELTPATEGSKLLHQLIRRYG